MMRRLATLFKARVQANSRPLANSDSIRAQRKQRQLTRQHKNLCVRKRGWDTTVNWEVPYCHDKEGWEQALVLEHMSEDYSSSFDEEENGLTVHREKKKHGFAKADRDAFRSPELRDFIKKCMAAGGTSRKTRRVLQPGRPPLWNDSVADLLLGAKKGTPAATWIIHAVFLQHAPEAYLKKREAKQQDEERSRVKMQDKMQDTEQSLHLRFSGHNLSQGRLSAMFDNHAPAASSKAAHPVTPATALSQLNLADESSPGGSKRKRSGALPLTEEDVAQFEAEVAAKTELQLHLAARMAAAQSRMAALCDEEAMEVDPEPAPKQHQTITPVQRATAADGEEDYLRRERQGDAKKHKKDNTTKKAPDKKDNTAPPSRSVSPASKRGAAMVQLVAATATTTKI